MPDGKPFTKDVRKVAYVKFGYRIGKNEAWN
jgi:hypothetical protein